MRHTYGYEIPSYFIFFLTVQRECLQYDLLVDINQNRQNMPAEYLDTPTAFFGQLQHIIVVQLPPAQELDPNLISPSTYILAAIHTCEVEAQNSMGMPVYSKMGRTEVVDITSVQCLIGRVPTGRNNQWVIIDRTGVTQQSVHLRDE